MGNSVLFITYNFSWLIMALRIYILFERIKSILFIIITSHAWHLTQSLSRVTRGLFSFFQVVLWPGYGDIIRSTHAMKSCLVSD